MPAHTDTKITLANNEYEAGVGFADFAPYAIYHAAHLVSPDGAVVARYTAPYAMWQAGEYSPDFIATVRWHAGLLAAGESTVAKGVYRLVWLRPLALPTELVGDTEPSFMVMAMLDQYYELSREEQMVFLARLGAVLTSEAPQ